MPEVEILTVTASSVAPDNVAVNVRDEPAFSAIEDALDVNVTVGALSFSVMVKVTDWEPLSVAPPPDTLLISTTAVSLSSYTGSDASSVGVKDAVPVVLPAEIVISEIVA